MQPEQQELSPSEQSLRYTVAGILSTIGFVPAQSHPAEMLTVSDLVIRTVRMMGAETVMGSEAGAVRSLPEAEQPH